MKRTQTRPETVAQPPTENPEDVIANLYPDDRGERNGGRAQPASVAAEPFLAPKQETLPAAPLAKLKTKRKLTLDVTNIAKLGQIVFVTRSELYTKELPSSYSETGRALVRCIDITDVVTNEEFMLACNTVLASALERAGQPLAGRYFAARCGDVVAGKRYRRVDVVELEPAP